MTAECIACLMPFQRVPSSKLDSNDSLGVDASLQPRADKKGATPARIASLAKPQTAAETVTAADHPKTKRKDN